MLRSSLPSCPIIETRLLADHARVWCCDPAGSAPWKCQSTFDSVVSSSKRLKTGVSAGRVNFELCVACLNGTNSYKLLFAANNETSTSSGIFYGKYVFSLASVDSAEQEHTSFYTKDKN